MEESYSYGLLYSENSENNKEVIKLNSKYNKNIKEENWLSYNHQENQIIILYQLLIHIIFIMIKKNLRL